MKATRKFGMWKAIAFLTVVISLFFCTSCENEPLLKAQISVNATENVTESSATIVAFVTPNQDNTEVTLRYQSNNSAWSIQTLSIKFSGTSSQKVTFDVVDLLPSTSYNFEVMASNAAGAVIADGFSFITKGLVKSVIKINAAENVKINSAKINATVIPNQNPTSIFIEYQAENSAWASENLGDAFGKDLVKVTLDLPKLQANTNYKVRVRTTNKAGEVISDIISFRTYAVADYDGNLYHTVTIGDQTWLQENLRTTHYANGDPIANVTDLKEWSKLSTGAYCYYDNDSSYAKVYGALYNWYVGSDKRGLIVGWHTPSYDEFGNLKDYLGGFSSAGPAVMDNSGYWKNLTDKTRQPNNSSGLSIVPNGGLLPISKTIG